MKLCKTIQIRTKFFLAISLLLLAVYSSSIQAGEKQRTPIVFYHENHDKPQLKKLQQDYSYPDYLSQGKTEFEKMILLKHWVYESLIYSEKSKYQPLKNSSRILRMARKKITFMCTNYAAVFLQASVSFGWTPRYIFLRKKSGEQHAANDIWSNQYRKWIFIDPTFNIHVEKNGIPLSMTEIRNEFYYKKGTDLVFVYGAGTEKRKIRFDELPITFPESRVYTWAPFNKDWPGYMYEIAVVGRNDFFSSKTPTVDNIWEIIYIIKDEINRNDEAWPFKSREAVRDLKRLFHDVNRADINLSLAQEKKSRKRKRKVIEVKMDAFGENNYSPYFKQFEIRIDEGTWEPRKNKFLWVLKPGKNRISGRIVNKFGIRGPVTHVEILNP